MQNGQASRTALGVALRRASHQIYDTPPLVFQDPIAVPLLGRTYAKALAESRASLHQTFSLALRAWVLARARFAEEELAKAVAAGVRQYVILGAGLDTFGLRNPYPDVRVFEIDHPSTQRWKRKLVAESKLAEPGSLRYVAVDFETQSLRERLMDAGLDFEIPAQFAMLGVAMYLTAEAFQENLDFIAGFPEYSGVVFDYALPHPMIPEIERYAREALAFRVASIGEPFRLFFSPDEVRVRLGCFGSVEDLDGEELNHRYFRGRTDELKVRGRSGRVVSARKVPLAL